MGGSEGIVHIVVAERGKLLAELLPVTLPYIARKNDWRRSSSSFLAPYELHGAPT